MLNNIFEISMLYDFYGDLLSQRQKEILGLYYSENYSLGEIAGEYGLTRQGIHETIKRGERKLRDYEKKLKLISKYESDERVINNLKDELEQLISMLGDDTRLTTKLKRIKEEIIRLRME